MRFNRTIALPLLLLTPLFHIQPAQAASDDECGIWMCLPTGFGEGCSGAKKAFKKRIKSFKSPLPSFASCLKGSPTGVPHDNFTARNGIAAYIPSQKVCTASERKSMHHEPTCIAWKTMPERYVKGQRCEREGDNRHRTPLGCVGTYSYTEVYRNGGQLGQTHYY